MRLRNPSRALVYVTFNGVHSNFNGIGRQTTTMIGTLSRYHNLLQQKYEPFSFHIVAPTPYDTSHWPIDNASIALASETARRTGGELHFCRYDVDNESFWSPHVWHQLCSSAAAVVSNIAHSNSNVTTLAVDAPFLGLTKSLRTIRCQDSSTLFTNVHCIYNTQEMIQHLEP